MADGHSVTEEEKKKQTTLTESGGHLTYLRGIYLSLGSRYVYYVHASAILAVQLTVSAMWVVAFQSVYRAARRQYMSHKTQ